MKYISTRGGIQPVSFKEAVMMGLATDGGLLLPQEIPAVKDQEINQWRSLSYQELAFEIFSKFIDDIAPQTLRELVNKSYSTFSHPHVAPTVKKDELYILELFHGPTLAFKDIALQFLGNLFEYILDETQSTMNILGATSGDTGSAAIHGVRGKKGIKIFILHPHKRVSPIQELQMTSVTDDNVYNIAINGTFDDGQAIVKSIFNDITFKNEHNLGAINSINWARVLAQIVYYIYSYLNVTGQTGHQSVDFSIPTGNFGDIFAGFIAQKILGKERINKLVLATNDNDILSRFILQGDYSTSAVHQTCSPSMDIQMASNFERYLYYLNNQDAKKTKSDMEQFAIKNKLHFTNEAFKTIQTDFDAKKVTEPEVIDTIKSFYSTTRYVLDPHTAVGVNAGLNHKTNNPMICLATAHPGKFGEAVKQAIGDQPLPDSLQSLIGMQTRCELMAADKETIKSYICNNSSSSQ